MRNRLYRQRRSNEQREREVQRRRQRRQNNRTVLAEGEYKDVVVVLVVVSITMSLFKRLTVEKAITKPVQFKMPARARLPLELRGDEGERKYKMAHLYSWTILSKTNTAFTDYTCNS